MFQKEQFRDFFHPIPFPARIGVKLDVWNWRMEINGYFLGDEKDEKTLDEIYCDYFEWTTNPCQSERHVQLYKNSAEIFQEVNI